MSKNESISDPVLGNILITHKMIQPKNNTLQINKRVEAMFTFSGKFSFISLHGRPSARLVRFVTFIDCVLILKVTRKEKCTSIHNLKDIMSTLQIVGFNQGDEVNIIAIGPESDKAIYELIRFISNEFANSPFGEDS